MPRRRRKTEHTWRFFCEEVEVFRSEANEAVRTIITGRRNHVWVNGNYRRERHGEHGVAHKWTEPGGQYHLREGHRETDVAK